MREPMLRARRATSKRRARLERLAALGLSALAACCGRSVAPTESPTSPAAGGAHSNRRLDDAWLAAIGTGKAQTARVCARGAKDRVSTAFCADPPPPVTSFGELYTALGLADPARRYVATTTHSLGLSGRFVSGLNPRSFAFVNDRDPIPLDRFVTVSFARGETLVELVGIDSTTLEYNFYLLRFELPCDATRCTPDDLLTEKVESGWTGVTLYSDRDLVDTPLDCTSCHQPFGRGSRKQLVMRQTASPWVHWGDFKGHPWNRICQPKVEPEPGPWIPGEGLELLQRLEGPSGRHAGIPIAELVASPSGERFSLFLTDVENTVRGVATGPYPYAQLDYDGAEVLCERQATGTSPTWDRMRKESLMRGLPVPYFGADVLDAERRAEVLADRAAYLTDREGEDSLALAMNLIGQQIQADVGFEPLPSEDGATILRQLCVRCHASGLDPGLRRSRFDAEKLDRIEPAVARSIRRRIQLPRESPELMPPLRAGELPDWAKSRVSDYLSQHCSDARPRACE